MYGTRRGQQYSYRYQSIGTSDHYRGHPMDNISYLDAMNLRITLHVAGSLHPAIL